MGFLQTHKKISAIALSVLIFGIFLAILIYFLNLKILKNEVESYSIADQIYYTLKCSNERHIKLRENAPSRTFTVYTKDENLENEAHVIVTDKNGLIKPSMVHKDPDLRIFFVGGSTTESKNASSEFRFPYYSGRLLEKKLGRKINSENAARSGNNSIHSINIVVNKLLPMNPDMIVMMHNINDLSTLFYEGTYWNDNKSRSNLSCIRRNRSATKSDEWGDSSFAQKILDDESIKDDLLGKFEKNLQLFISIVKSQDVIPVLMTQPNIIEGNEKFTMQRDARYDSIYRDLYAKFNDKIREVARKNNVLLIDLAKKIPQEKIYLYDGVHANNKGSILESEVISDSIYRYLKRIKYFNN